MSNIPNDRSDRTGSTTSPVNRRRFLGYTGVAGATGLGLATPGAGASFGGNGTEIVIARDNDGPDLTREVPTQWYQQTQASRRVQNALANRYENASWLGDIKRHASGPEIGGMETFEITVGARNVAAARQAVPDELEGISIDVEEYDEPTPEWCNTNTYSCMQGGQYVTVERNDGYYVSHSGTCVVKNSSGYVRYMTCAHGFLVNCDDDIKYNKMYTGSSNYYVGYVTDWDKWQDFAVVRESGYSDIRGFHNRVLGEYDRPIRGHVSEDGIDYLASNTRQVRKYGAKTCKTKGDLKGDTVHKYCGGHVRRSYQTTNTDNGDSGSPHYMHTKRNGKWVLYIIGPHYGSGSTYSFSSLGYRINERHGITFGGAYTC